LYLQFAIHKYLNNGFVFRQNTEKCKNSRTAPKVEPSDFPSFAELAVDTISFSFISIHLQSPGMVVLFLSPRMVSLGGITVLPKVCIKRQRAKWETLI